MALLDLALDDGGIFAADESGSLADWNEGENAR
jgi:hypothetical protein